MKNNYIDENKLIKYEKTAYITIVVFLLLFFYFNSISPMISRYFGIYGYIEIGIEIVSISIIAAIFRYIIKAKEEEKVKNKVIIVSLIYILLKIIITVIYTGISNRLGGINIPYEMVSFILNIKNAILVYGVTIFFLNEKKKYIAKSVFSVVFIYFFVDISGISCTHMVTKDNVVVSNISMLMITICLYCLTAADLIKIVKSDSPKKDMIISKLLLVVMALYLLSFINPFKYTGAWEYKNSDGKVDCVILLRGNKTVEYPYSSQKLKYRINYLSMPSQIIFYSENDKQMPLSLFGYDYYEKNNNNERVLYATNIKIYLHGNLLIKNSSWGISIENVLFNIKSYCENYKSKKLIRAVLANDFDKCKKIIEKYNNESNKANFLYNNREERKNPIYYIDENGYNAMHYALISKNDKLINLFLDNNIQLYTNDNIEKYLFDIKYSEKTKEMVFNKLIYRDKKAVFSVILTTNKEPVQIIKKLIENKMSVNIRDIDGDELVSGIIDSGMFNRNNEKVIEAIDFVFKNGFNPDVINKDGKNALSKVIKYNDIELTKYLLSKGYKISFLESNQVSPMFGMFYSIKDRMEMLNLLIENNAKLDTRDKKQRIPLFNIFNTYNLTVDDFVFAVNIYKSHNVSLDIYDSDGKNIISYFKEKFDKKSDKDQNKIDEITEMLLKEIDKNKMKRVKN